MKKPKLVLELDLESIASAPVGELMPALGDALRTVLLDRLIGNTIHVQGILQTRTGARLGEWRIE